MRDMRDYFGDVISVYTDAQALEDGVLVDISSYRLAFREKLVNRMTRTVYRELLPFARLLNPYAFDDVNPKHMVATKLQFAGEGDGDIVKVPPRYWLLENEVDGWTLMAPEDY